jgi:DHA2 family multidrug resistance protein-like MFS transporter
VGFVPLVALAKLTCTESGGYLFMEVTPVIGTRRWWALGAVSLSVLAVSLDGTVLSVALPTLAGALDASEPDLVWFSSGYLLVLAAAMLPAGVLGDRFGRKKVALASLATFGVGSAVCAYAGSVGMFLVGRLVQGIAGSGITVMAISALVVLFSAEERPRAVGVFQGANFVALPLGPILGGWMLAHFWWGWVFLINVPVVVVGLVAGAVLIPESRAPEAPGLDPVGIATSTAGLVAVVYGLIEAGEHGWSYPAVPASILVGAVTLVGFARWERRLGGRALIDLNLFRSASFTWGTLLSALAGAAMIGVLFTIPQFFQGVRGMDSLGAGVRLLPLIVGLLIGAGLASRLGPLLGARATVTAGFVVLAGGLGIGSLTGISTGTPFVAGWTAVVGAGTGLALSGAFTAAISGLAAERSGTESAVIQAVQKAAGPFGAAITGSVLVAGYQARFHPTGLPAAAVATARQSVYGGVAVARRLGSPTLADAARGAFVHGMSLALLVAAGIAVAGAVAAVTRLPLRVTPGRGTSSGQGTSSGRGTTREGAASMARQADDSTLGLRERKKAKTRATIQSHALRLFRERGYQSTTVEQIITAAEVSETTFFRYFPTKEDVVLQDDFDPLIIAALRGQPLDLPPISAVRAAYQEFFGSFSAAERQEIRDRVALVSAVPALRAAMFDQFAQAIGLLADVLAERAGRPPGDLAVRTVAGAVVGVMLVALTSLIENPNADLFALLDESLGQLEAGLTL